MKKLFIIGLIFLVTISASSYCNGQGEKLLYTEIIKTDSVNQKELYLRAKQWFATTYNNSKTVLQIDDKESGQLLGKAGMSYNSTVFIGSDATRGMINYTIKIFVKDGRYKYEITDVIHDSRDPQASMSIITTDSEYPWQVTSGTNKKWCDRVWLDIKHQLDPYMKNLIFSLKKGMEEKSTSGDW